MILDEIVAWKKTEVEKRKREVPRADIERRAAAARPRDFEKGLMRPGRLSVLAEIKRASPTAGAIRPDADAAALAAAMEGAGADAISVLTDARYFSGGLADLSAARSAVSIPVLEKDFVIDEYQIFEAAASGADAVLLIMRILDERQLASFYATAKSLGLGCLVEVNGARDLDRAATVQPPLIGINNRDLSTFIVDIQTTLELMPLVPAGVRVVSQSGISSPEQALRLFEAGVAAIQVGESLMRAADPAEKIRQLLSLVQ